MAKLASHSSAILCGFLLLAFACDQPQTGSANTRACSTTSDCTMGYTCDATSRRCAGIFFPLKGSVDGLEESRSLQLQQAGEVITLFANGPFSFTGRIQQDASFAIQVVAQPRGLTCTASPATGTMNGDATSIDVKCTRTPASCFYNSDCDTDSYCDVAKNTCKPSNFTLTGEVVGLGSKQNIILFNNNDALTVQGSRKFTFAARLRDQDSYDVKIALSPRYHRCQVTGGSGVATGNVSSVRVDCTCAVDTLPDRLQCLPFPWNDSSFYTYVLYLTQPLDHANPQGQTFTQRAVLALPWGGGPKDRPLGIGTGGYNIAGSVGRGDPATAFDGYGLQFEHRYFGGSFPLDSAGDSLAYDFKYLNVKQTADDAHAWIEAIKPYLTGPRIMSGVSKGGVHSLVSAYYYPDDVNATVAYVAPAIQGIGDPVFADWINNKIGGDAYAACRRNLNDFIIQALKRRAEIVALIPRTAELLKHFPGERGIEASFQNDAFGIRWPFWQYFGPADSRINCNTIPKSTSATFPQEALSFIAAIQSNAVNRYEPDPSLVWGTTFWWQSNTELGTVNYGQDIPELTTQLDQSLIGPTVPETFPPYMPQRMEAVNKYIETDAQRIIIIYGALDPWSARQYTVNNAKDSYVFVAPELNHGAAIENLTAADYEKALWKLEGWLGVKRSPFYERVVATQ